MPNKSGDYQHSGIFALSLVTCIFGTILPSIGCHCECGYMIPNTVKHCMHLWRPRRRSGASRASGLSLSRGFVGSPTRARSLFSAFLIFGQTLSERRGVPHPTGSLTARVLGDGGSAPLRISTLPSSFVGRCLGLRARSLTGSSQLGPAP